MSTSSRPKRVPRIPPMYIAPKITEEEEEEVAEDVSSGSSSEEDEEEEEQQDEEFVAESSESESDDEEEEEEAVSDTDQPRGEKRVREEIEEDEASRAKEAEEEAEEEAGGEEEEEEEEEESESDEGVVVDLAKSDARKTSATGCDDMKKALNGDKKMVKVFEEVFSRELGGVVPQSQHGVPWKQFMEQLENPLVLEFDIGVETELPGNCFFCNKEGELALRIIHNRSRSWEAVHCAGKCRARAGAMARFATQQRRFLEMCAEGSGFEDELVNTFFQDYERALDNLRRIR